MWAEALRYSQRVLRLLGMGTETWRVRTRGGALARVAQARAASQLSVELWVLMTSTGLAASQRRMAKKPGRRLRPMGRATTGTPRPGASW